MSHFASDLLATLALIIGSGVIGALVIFGWIQIGIWIGKAVIWVYRKVTGKPKPEKPKREVYKPKTWSDGWNDRGEIADRSEKHLRALLDDQRAQTEKWFNDYLRVAFPEGYAAKKAAEQAQAEKALIPVADEHTDAVFDTDE